MRDQVRLVDIVRDWADKNPPITVITWDSVVSPEYEGDIIITCSKCNYEHGLVRDNRVVTFVSRPPIMAADPEFFNKILATFKHTCHARPRL
jgi:hypothetical protein